jgi:hypothetical protein
MESMMGITLTQNAHTTHAHTLHFLDYLPSASLGRWPSLRFLNDRDSEKNVLWVIIQIKDYVVQSRENRDHFMMEHKMWPGGRQHWVVGGTGKPKDRDEVQRREVWECDGWVCDLEDTGVASIFRLIRSAGALAKISHPWKTCFLWSDKTWTRGMFFIINR